MLVCISSGIAQSWCVLVWHQGIECSFLLHSPMISCIFSLFIYLPSYKESLLPFQLRYVRFDWSDALKIPGCTGTTDAVIVQCGITFYFNLFWKRLTVSIVGCCWWCLFFSFFFFSQVIIELSVFFSSAKDNLASTAHVSVFVLSLPGSSWCTWYPWTTGASWPGCK